MNEAEIDALMAGQEDESGCVNYEGKPRIGFQNKCAPQQRDAYQIYHHIKLDICIIKCSMSCMLFAIHINVYL